MEEEQERDEGGSSKFRNIVYLEVPYMGVGLSISEHTAAGFSLNTVTLG